MGLTADDRLRLLTAAGCGRMLGVRSSQGVTIVSRSKTCLRDAVHTAWREKRCQAVGQVSATMAKFDADLPPSRRELIVKNQQRLDVWR
jgi:hypothetical protein